MTTTFLLWEHPAEYLRPADVAQAQAIVALLHNTPKGDQPHFAALAEAVLNQLPEDLGAPGAHAAATESAFFVAMEDHSSPVLVLELAGAAANHAPELVRCAIAQGLCVCELDTFSVFTPWGRLAGGHDPSVWKAWAACLAPVRLDENVRELRLRRLLQRELALPLAAAGFTPKGADAAYMRAFPGGEQEVRLLLAGGFWWEIGLETRHASVIAALRPRFGERGAQALGRHLLPLHRFAANLAPFEAYPDEEGACRAALAATLESMGIPMLDACQDLQVLDATLNAPAPSDRVPAAAPDDRPLRLAVARLAGNEKFDQLYRECLNACGEVPQATLAALVSHLKTLPPLPSTGKDREAAGQWLAKLHAANRSALLSHRKTLLQAQQDCENPEDGAAMIDDWQTILRALIPVAEPHGFRVCNGGQLVRPIPGGQQAIEIAIHFSNSALTLAYVTFRTTLHEVNQVYQRATNTGMGTAATWHVDPYALWPEKDDPGFPERTYADTDRFAQAQAAIVRNHVIPLFDRYRAVADLAPPLPDSVSIFPAPPIARGWALSVVNFSALDQPPISLVWEMQKGRADFELRVAGLREAILAPRKGDNLTSEERKQVNTRQLAELDRFAGYLRRYLAMPGTRLPGEPGA